MCVLSIELVLVEIYGKMGEKPPFLGIFEVWYPYHFGTGTILVMVDFSVPVPNVLFWTSVSVWAITWSFLIRFE